MTEPHGEAGSPLDSREKRIGEILRSAGLPMGLAMLRYATVHGRFRMHELSENLGQSVHSGRTTMGKMQKLGLFVKSNASARDVVYDLTREGMIVARCVEQLIDLDRGKETKSNG